MREEEHKGKRHRDIILDDGPGLKVPCTLLSSPGDGYGEVGLALVLVLGSIASPNSLHDLPTVTGVLAL